MNEFDGHTPGPWFVISGHILAGSENQLDDGEALAIADIDMDMRIDFDTTGAANARLIAAAPTLLAQRDALVEALGDLTEIAEGALAMIDAKRKRGDFDHWESFELGDFGGTIQRARAALREVQMTRVRPQ